MGLKEKIEEFVMDPYDLVINMDLAVLYEAENQLASAISHYVRAAEYGLDSSSSKRNILIYESLLRAAICFDKLGRRMYVTKGLIYQAISFMPEMPDAYLLLCKMHEKSGEWFECNASAASGINALEGIKNKFEDYKLSYEVRTYNSTMNELLYQRAMSDYYSGRTMRARVDFLEIMRRPELQDWIKIACINSLGSIGYTERFNTIGYNKVKSSKEVFKNCNFVSYSQCMQDILVSSIIGKGGKYLEIGSADPFGNSNTYLLERDFGWSGISVEYVEDLVNKFNTSRINKAVLADATSLDYDKLLNDNGIHGDLEYLQLDCEPADVTYNVLTKMPFDSRGFAIITYEHDSYKGNDHIKQMSREFLKSKGYELLISDVAHNCVDSFEDWWVHPEYVTKFITKEKLNTIKNVSNGSKCVLDIFL